MLGSSTNYQDVDIGRYCNLMRLQSCKKQGQRTPYQNRNKEGWIDLEQLENVLELLVSKLCLGFLVSRVKGTCLGMACLLRFSTDAGWTCRPESATVKVQTPLKLLFCRMQVRNFMVRICLWLAIALVETNKQKPVAVLRHPINFMEEKS